MKDNKQHAPLQILLADDDIDDRFFFDKALQEIPIETALVTVYNGEQLMNYLGENTENLPDLLFLDLSMPRKTGFECLSEIKENIKLKDLPVVMFTTSFTRGIDFEDNLKNTLSRMGAMDYIRKPGDFEELKQVIHQALISLLEKEQFTVRGNNL
jgi:CheY-like chemotaxis protein